MNEDTDTEQNTGIVEASTEEEAVSKELAGIDELSIRIFGELPLDDLVDKWAQLEGDYIFLKWQLAKLIADKFKSKIKFGKFLQAFKTNKPNHAFCTINQSTFYRYAHAASFCNKFRIYDLRKAGILPSAIYALSKIKHQKVVNQTFLKTIEHRNLPVDEIIRLIDQSQSLLGEQTSESKQSSETESPSQDADDGALNAQEPLVQPEASTMMEGGLCGETKPPEADINQNDDQTQPTIQPVPIFERPDPDKLAQATFDFWLSVTLSPNDMKYILAKTAHLVDQYQSELFPS
jgi:hypothetical protein